MTISIEKMKSGWWAMIDHQHEGFGKTKAEAIADAKKSKASSDEDDDLAQEDERMIDRM